MAAIHLDSAHDYVQIHQDRPQPTSRKAQRRLGAPQHWSNPDRVTAVVVLRFGVEMLRRARSPQRRQEASSEPLNDLPGAWIEVRGEPMASWRGR